MTDGAVVANDAGDVIAAAEQLWTQRPETAETVTVVALTGEGKPVITSVPGVSSTDELADVIAANLGTEVSWETTMSVAATEEPLQFGQWGLTRVAAPTAWSTTTGRGVTVAVLDTGVAAHPDLRDNLLPGFDFVDNDTSTTDVHGHGTHVAGIVAAARNGIGVAGVAPDARILPVKVLSDSGSGTTTGVANGIVWAVGNGADVINLSLAGAASPSVSTAIAYAVSRDVVVVAAAGNGGLNGVTYWPGADPNAIGVASTDSSGLPSSFSSRGSYVDVAAPGGSVWSTYPGDGYASMSGTSMAAPHVAAVAALVRQARPELSEIQVRAVLTSGALDVAPAGVDPASGAGVVNAPAALSAATPWAVAPPSTLTARVNGLDVTLAATAVSSPAVAGYRFERNGVLVATSPTPSALDVNRATQAGTYTYTVRLVGPSGELSEPRALSFTVSPPMTPRITTTSVSSATTVTLKMSSAPPAWIVYRNGAVVAPAATTATSITLRDEPLGRHTYQVRAVSPSGTSALSAPVSATIALVVPSSPRAFVSGLDVTVSAGTVIGASSYRISRNGAEVATVTTPRFVDPDRATMAGIYTYRITPVASGGGIGPAASAQVEVRPPTTPVLSGSASGQTVTLRFTNAVASSWWVYRDGVRIATFTGGATGATLTSQPLGTWTYTVRAMSGAGASAASNPLTVTARLHAPSTVTVTVDDTALRVAAAPVPGAVSYRFSRNGELLGEQVSPVLVDPDRATTPAAVSYTVAAIDAGGVVGMPRTSVFQVRPPSTPTLASVTASVTSPGAVTFTTTGTAPTWLVYRDGVKVAAVPGRSRTFTVAGVTAGPATFEVRATNATGTSPPSNRASASVG